MAESVAPPPSAPVGDPEDNPVLGMYRLNISSSQAIINPQNLSKFEVLMPQELQRTWDIKSGSPCLTLEITDIAISGLCNIKTETLYIYFKNVYELSDINQTPGNFGLKFVIQAGSYTLEELLTHLNNYGAGYYQFQFYTSTINKVSKKRLCLNTMLPPDIRELYKYCVLNVSSSLAAKLGMCLAKTDIGFHCRRYSIPLIPSSSLPETPVMPVAVPPPAQCTPSTTP